MAHTHAATRRRQSRERRPSMDENACDYEVSFFFLLWGSPGRKKQNHILASLLCIHTQRRDEGNPEDEDPLWTKALVTTRRLFLFCFGGAPAEKTKSYSGSSYLHARATTRRRQPRGRISYMDEGADPIWTKAPVTTRCLFFFLM